MRSLYQRLMSTHPLLTVDASRSDCAVAASAHRGFTIVELVAVILLLGILAAVALPRFTDMSREARIANLNQLAGSMRATISLVQAKARVQGLTPVSTNPAGPGGSDQSGYIVETVSGRAEVDFRNLCPESRAELGDALDMPAYMALSLSDGVTIDVTNQHTRIGFEITNNQSSGCYVEYDSFGNPDCTVAVIDADC